MSKVKPWLIVVFVLLLVSTGDVHQIIAMNRASDDGPLSAPEQMEVIPGIMDGKPSPNASVARTELATASMSENFESTWPAPGWTVVDASSSDGGEYLWGKRNCHPRTGTYGGWSVGGGAQGSALSAPSGVRAVRR